ncbi:benzyl alcohol O-benzoyltransferase-like [Macadamia integrifolia]|uniref:benzyl alcohol O-benzoyltransferase-like n=1 Tax=Macadamia integrifolia TaxID=60698 RepID=UPI001C4E4000|nr:benzyl alcohol O-benzoyltransferase-like [Macadamia integrifolia]
MASSPSSLVFKVQRCEPELVTPAKPTPHEFKYLSDIDDQECLRFQLPMIQVYRNEPEMREKNPVKVIRKALAEALVFYYPLAGRIREVHGRKLVVDCTGEGALFIEADADVSLDQFSDAALLPTFSCLKELLYDVPGSSDIIGCPLLLIQVTRLMCGGFIFALRLNHTLGDAAGLLQFMSTLGEMARGAQSPSVPPVWKRELLNARDPHPSGVTFLHREYDEVPDTKGTLSIPLDDMAHRPIFLGPSELAALRKHLPFHLRKCTTFELLTACLWRCRTIAIEPEPEEDTRVVVIVNARAKFRPPVPVGYYGNVLAFTTAISTAAELCQNPLSYALELVKKAKSEATEEFMRSQTNLLVMKGRPHLTAVRNIVVSDLTRANFVDVDFGWGKAVYGGPAKTGVGIFPGVLGFYIAFRDHKGVDGIVVSISLPGPAMERFVTEIENMVKEPPVDG